VEEMVGLNLTSHCGLASEYHEEVEEHSKERAFDI